MAQAARAFSQGVPAQSRASRGNGGTSAPASAARGPNVSQNQSFKPYWGENKPWGPASQQNQGGPGTIYTKPAAGGGTAATAAHKPGTPMPWDGTYEGAVNNANAKYNNALISLGAKKGFLQQEYGLDEGFNDYKSNPYSRAALLEQTYQRAGRASGNSLAAAGQLYSGASQNAETYNREHNSQERNSLEQLYRSSLQQNEDEKTGAGNARNEEINNAGWKRLEALGNAELEPETTSSGGGGPAPVRARVNTRSGSALATPKKPQTAKAFSRKGK